MPSKKYLFLIYLQLVSSLQLQTNSRLSGFVLVNNNITYVEKLLPSQINIAVDDSILSLELEYIFLSSDRQRCYCSTLYHFEKDANMDVYTMFMNFMPYLISFYIIFYKEVDNRSDWHQESFNAFEGNVVNPELAHVRFEPPILYFRDKTVGNSYRETVHIFNTSHNKTLSLDKVAGGKTNYIQIAAFGQELISPGGNTTFDIVFIGQDMVPLSTHFYVHTSKGILKYNVISWCVDNPFEITPLSPIILPLNSTYTRSITLRNPFDEPLHITEALLYDGRFFSYSLPPSVDSRNAIESWTIKPYETKGILRIHFAARQPCNVSTFQSIKLSTGTTLLIPVEVEVTPHTGLYVPSHKIDFETGGHLDPPAVKPLLLCSSAPKTVTIENVSCEPEVRGCEITDFKPVVLAPSSCVENPVAKMKFIWNAKLPGEVTSGALLIKNDLDAFFRLNYTARVHHGGLTYNSSLTQYVTGVPFQSSARPFAFTNEYRQLVAVLNVYLSFEAAEYFHIRGFEPSVLKPSQQKVLFQLQIRNGVELSKLKLDSSILLETNISTIRLPLRVYDGFLTKLSKVAPSALNVGLVGTRSAVVTQIAVLNENPETVFIQYFGCNDSNVRVQLLDVQPGNARTFFYRSFARNASRMVRPGGFSIRPRHYASFQLSVETGNAEEEVYAEVWVQSDHEKLVFPFYMHVAKGFVRVSPNPFVFEDCFPGAYCVQQLTVESHFTRSMLIMNISTIPHTSYHKLLFYPSVPALISGHSTSIVGNILWEPTIDSPHTRPLGYLGLPNNATGRDRWLGTIERLNATRDLDMTLMESQYLRYREQFSAPIHLIFRMDTTEVRNFLFNATIRLQWPQIVSTRVIDFPLVQIGSTAYQNLTIYNPMHSHYMTVQVVMAYNYPQEVPTVVGNILSEYEEPGAVESKSNEFFLDLDNNSPYKKSTLVGTQRKFVSHRSSLVFVLPPQENATMSVGFVPSSQTLITARLYIRNDFTILDSVAINGAGAFPQLALDGLDNSASNLIKFSIPIETLKLCEENHDRVINITTKRVFRLRNTGQVSVNIFGLTVNGAPCQGYGFKITNCHNIPFTLKPGMSKRVEVSFTPDFTSAHVESILQVESDMKMGSMLSYTLYAALDYEWLCKCRPHLQRPYWEPLLYYLMIGIFFSLLIGVTILAVHEVSANTSRLLNSFENTEPKVQPVYDIKLIENFFVRSRVPHHHNHHFHHQNLQHVGVRRLSPALSNGTVGCKHSADDLEELGSRRSSSSCAAVDEKKEFNWTADDKPFSLANKTISSLSVALSVVSAQVDNLHASALSSQSLIYNCDPKAIDLANMTNGCENNTKSEKVTICPNSGSDKQRIKNATNSTAVRLQTEQNQSVSQNSTTVPNEVECAEDGALTGTKKNRKCDFEEVSYKSNCIKKKQSKKEEKMAGNKFLKNGWTRCWKGSHAYKDTNMGEEKQFNDDKCTIQSNSADDNVNDSCPSISTRKDVFMEEISSSNVSSHGSNNSKFSNKDVPRKLDNNKTNIKKSSHETSTIESVPKSPSSPKRISWSEVEVNEDSSNNASKTNIKNTRQKKKKNVEASRPVMKDSAKENCSIKLKSETCKKSANKEKSNRPITSPQQVGEQRKLEEALKPITNLPKVKEPFETLSSLCNRSASLKSRRRSNGKKRVKDEKFVNIAKELSIVFTTPENLNHKSDCKKATISVNQQQEKLRNTTPPLTSASGKVANNTCGIAINNSTNHTKDDKETRLLNEHKFHSVPHFGNCNGALYSRVVAPPISTSSPSFLVSDDTGCYKSAAAFVSNFTDNQLNTNGFWGTWNNGIFSKRRTARHHYIEMPSANDVCYKRAPVASNSVWNASNVGRQNDEQTAANRMKYHNSYPAKISINVPFEDDQKRILSKVESGPFKLPKSNRAEDRNSAQMQQSTVNDIWGPPTSFYSSISADSSASSCNLPSDAVSAISLSRLLRFEEKKEKETDQYGSLSSLWSTDTKSLWAHPKQE